MESDFRTKDMFSIPLGETGLDASKQDLNSVVKNVESVLDFLGKIKRHDAHHDDLLQVSNYKRYVSMESINTLHEIKSKSIREKLEAKLKRMTEELADMKKQHYTSLERQRVHQKSLENQAAELRMEMEACEIEYQEREDEFCTEEEGKRDSIVVLRGQIEILVLLEDESNGENKKPSGPFDHSDVKRGGVTSVQIEQHRGLSGKSDEMDLESARQGPPASPTAHDVETRATSFTPHVDLQDKYPSPQNHANNVGNVPMSGSAHVPQPVVATTPSDSPNIGSRDNYPNLGHHADNVEDISLVGSADVHQPVVVTKPDISRIQKPRTSRVGLYPGVPTSRHTRRTANLANLMELADDGKTAVSKTAVGK